MPPYRLDDIKFGVGLIKLPCMLPNRIQKLYKIVRVMIQNDPKTKFSIVLMIKDWRDTACRHTIACISRTIKGGAHLTVLNQNISRRKKDIRKVVIPEPTARSVSPGRGLLISHGYLHPGNCEHSEV